MSKRPTTRRTPRQEARDLVQNATYYGIYQNLAAAATAVRMHAKDLNLCDTCRSLEDLNRFAAELRAAATRLNPPLCSIACPTFPKEVPK